jgi:C4-dicarboxylate-specific signal transduction histidine kinase
MSASGARMAIVQGESTQTPLAYLLHALNQPLTGLQCSLELALAGPCTSERYIATLRDGLHLTGRMRVLMEALRELVDAEQDEGEKERISLDALLRQTVDDLRPVAESKGVGIQFLGDAALSVEACRQRLAAAVFRLLESALSLAAEGSILRIAARAQHNTADITVSWNETAPAPEYSPFSRPELGLLLAGAGWRRAGGEWLVQHLGKSHTVTARLPLAYGSDASTKPGDHR